MLEMRLKIGIISLSMFSCHSIDTDPSYEVSDPRHRLEFSVIFHPHFLYCFKPKGAQNAGRIRYQNDLKEGWLLQGSCSLALGSMSGVTLFGFHGVETF